MSEERLSKIDTRIGDLDRKIDTKIDALDRKIDGIDHHMRLLHEDLVGRIGEAAERARHRG